MIKSELVRRWTVECDTCPAKLEGGRDYHSIDDLNSALRRNRWTAGAGSAGLRHRCAICTDHGPPDTILGYPVVVSDVVPESQIVVGDWSEQRGGVVVRDTATGKTKTVSAKELHALRDEIDKKIEEWFYLTGGEAK